MLVKYQFPSSDATVSRRALPLFLHSKDFCRVKALSLKLSPYYPLSAWKNESVSMESNK